MEIQILKKGIDLPLTKLEMGFIVLIDKQPGWTSFDICRKIRNIVGIKKVGHAGTLDPFATGLLLVGVGKGTKELTRLSLASKEYNATVKFGIATDTFDITGKIIASVSDIDMSKAEIDNMLIKMTGEIEQIPPMYSAKKIKGKALYKYARQGEEIVRQPVKINVFRSALIKWDNPYLELEMHVSKGTYIRAYANDLGKALGVPAVLEKLRRTKIDKFDVRDSFTIEQFNSYWASDNV